MEPLAHPRRRRAGTLLCLVAVLAGGRAGAETISDPEDTGPKRAPVAPPPDTRTLWRGSATLRLGVDPRHESSSTTTAGAYHEEVMDLLGEARLELQHQVRPWLRLQAGGRLWYHLTARRPPQGAGYWLFNGEVHRNDLEPELLDSGVSINWRWLSVDAGLVTEVLGATDLTSPNDVLTVRDLRAGVTLDPEASRFPAPMLKVAAELRGFTLMGALLPLFVPHRVDLYGTDFALLGPLGPDVLQWVGAFAEGLVDDSVAAEMQGALATTRRPRPFADPALAARVARRIGGWELALQYAWLHEKLPVFRAQRGLLQILLPVVLRGGEALTVEDRRQIAAELAAQGTLPVESSYRRQHQAGLSVAGSFWRLGISFDLAYLSREAVNLGSASPVIDDGDGWLSTSVDSQVLAYTLGLTYVRGEEWLVTVEGWHRVYLDLATRPPAERPKLLLGQPQQGGLALLARYRRALPASLQLSAQLLALSDLANRSIILTPEVALRWGDHLQVGLGAAIYDGAEASLGGRLKRNTQLFVVLRAFL